MKRRAVEDVSTYHRDQKVPTNEPANRERTTRFSDSEANVLAEAFKSKQEKYLNAHSKLLIIVVIPIFQRLTNLLCNWKTYS